MVAQNVRGFKNQLMRIKLPTFHEENSMRLILGLDDSLWCIELGTMIGFISLSFAWVD